MNKIEKSELLLVLYAKMEETEEKLKNAQSEVEIIRAQGSRLAIGSIIQTVTDDF